MKIVYIYLGQKRLHFIGIQKKKYANCIESVISHLATSQIISNATLVNVLVISTYLPNFYFLFILLRD